jgi:hypothetical protein
MKDELKYILGIINDLQRFAEAKHAGLIILNSAIIIGVLSTFSNIHIYEKYSIIISLSLLGISIFGSLIAQFPVTSNIHNTIQSLSNPNIYYFEDLSKISINEFINEFKTSYISFVADNSDRNIINQILVNAKITSTKFFVFKYCVYTSTLGIGILGFSTLINVLCHL